VVLLVVYSALLLQLGQSKLVDGSLLRDAAVIFSAAARVIIVGIMGLNGTAGVKRNSIGTMLLSRLFAYALVVTMLFSKSGQALVAGAGTGLVMLLLTSRHDLAAVARGLGLLSKKNHDALFMPPPAPPRR